MKIVHVVDSMEIGGAETLVAQMCRLQREQGHDPQIFAIAALGPLGEQLRTEGFVVRANMAQHLPDALRSFYRAFKESRPDVVHLHNATPTIYAAPPARLAGLKRIVSTRHGLVDQSHTSLAELKYAAATTFCDWIVGICDATVQNLRSFRTIPRRKIIRVYNGTAPIAPVPPDRWPTKIGFTLLFVGRLASVKNLPLMLNSFRAALHARSDLRLWIVGDGSERNRLEKLAEQLNLTQEVKFWGQQLDVAPFFSAADAFVMSSISEGLPMSLLQAFSVGLPAIVTDVGGMAEVVRLAKAGYVTPSDCGEIAQAILRLAVDDTERRRLSTMARNAFDAHFGLQRMSSGYLDLYQNGIGTKPEHPR